MFRAKTFAPKQLDRTWLCTSRTELFKGSKDSASLVVRNEKNFFGWGLQILWVTS